ncbi:MAG TPA: medium chain dehydrogenase/reductase family protein, partial [Anaeromyxobacteraceae bacterium]|nr:medium chain dehydrogenase/reductase family protein [Anaeromyxobacteraceae bacterium]
MRAIFITRRGGPEVLSVRELPDPVPGPGEVRVAVRAAGLNFADVMARMGLYPDAPRLPAVVGYEVAGEVDAVGPGVTSPAPGDRVLAFVRFGGHAEKVVLPATQALPMPGGMTFEQGAALPVVYLTAWHALFRVGHLAPGRTVLVHMAAGGVGIAALQLCATVPGVTVIGTASAAKHGVLREEGCHHAIDYRTQDYEAEVRRITGGRGVDLVLDALGGADWRKGYRLLRPAGQLVTLGFANLAAGPRRSVTRALRQLLSVPRFSPIALMDDNRGVAGVNMGHLWGEAEMVQGEFQAILALFRDG